MVDKSDVPRLYKSMNPPIELSSNFADLEDACELVLQVKDSAVSAEIDDPTCEFPSWRRDCALQIE
jgi:hypothetical protein